MENLQDTIFGGFAPQSQTAEALSKALGSRTILSGYVSTGKGGGLPDPPDDGAAADDSGRAQEPAQGGVRGDEDRDPPQQARAASGKQKRPQPLQWQQGPGAEGRKSMSLFGNIYQEDLSLRSKLVYMYLKDRANKEGQCWPAIQTIGRDPGISRSTVKRAIRELEQAAPLSRQGRKRRTWGYLESIPHSIDPAVRSPLRPEHLLDGAGISTYPSHSTKSSAGGHRTSDRGTRSASCSRP